MALGEQRAKNSFNAGRCVLQSFPAAGSWNLSTYIAPAIFALPFSLQPFSLRPKIAPPFSLQPFSLLPFSLWPKGLMVEIFTPKSPRTFCHRQNPPSHFPLTIFSPRQYASRDAKWNIIFNFSWFWMVSDICQKSIWCKKNNNN